MFFSLYKIISKSLYGTGISKIFFIRKLHLKLTEYSKPEIIDVFGYKMFLDKQDDACHSITTDQMTDELKVLKKIIKKGDTVIDVGANIGFYTLFFCSLVGKTGKVIAFEPESKNFDILKKNIEMNNLDNVTLHQKAVGSKNSKVKMKISDSIGSHQISNSGDIEVDCIKLDNYVINANFVKIDAEGYEVEILKGMSKILHQNITLMMEFNINLIKNHSDPIEFFNILSQMNFKFQDMRNKFCETNGSKILMEYKNKSHITDIMCTKNNDC